MDNEWMIDVLTDLRKFAQKQAMMDLAEHLDDAILVAAAELHTLERGRNVLGANDYQDRNLSGAFTDNEYAG